MKKMYKKTPGSRLTQPETQEFGERIDWLQTSLGRDISPQDIVADSERAGSPFKEFLNRGIENAREVFKIEKARYILRHIAITIIHNGKKEDTRAFISLSSEDIDCKPAYISIERALTDKDKRRRLLAEALIELNFWSQKYKRLIELSRIFHVIKIVGKQLKIKAK